MRNINEVSREILLDTPKSLYILAGSEFGVKQKYIDRLFQFYDNNCIEVDKFSYLIDRFTKKHLMDMKPCLYIVRYDDTFVSTLDDSLAKKVRSMDVSGTILLIYDNEKQSTKLDKYLPEFTCSVDKVAHQFVLNYLKQEFTQLPEDLLKRVTVLTPDYNQAKLVCNSLCNLSSDSLYNMTDSDISYLFGYDATFNETNLKSGIASKNLLYLCKVVENYDADLTSIFYTMLSVCLDIEKALRSKYSTPEYLKKYVQFWNMESCYNLFNHVYQELIYSRRTSGYDIKSRMYYVFLIMSFKNIPSLGEVKC